MSDNAVTRAPITAAVAQDQWEGRYATWLSVLGLALVFGVSHSQFPLYYLTQNQYFFYGLARAGVGLLRYDWLANTADTWPVFSMLVELTYRYLYEHLFYFYYIILLGIYAYSMIGIVSSVVSIGSSRAKYFAFLVVMTALHSPVLDYFSRGAVGFNLGRELVTGVAIQRILWDMLTPSAFGVFLLLSICLFLRGKPVLSVVASSVAATFHPMYLLSAGVLTLSYMVVMIRRRERLRGVLAIGVYAFCLVLPVLVYALIAFHPTDPDTTAGAQAVLVHFRNVRHLVPAVWFNALAFMKIAVTVVALYLIRRTELFWVMFLSFAVAGGLTIVQVVTKSDTLALLAPWRLSVFLVPISSLIVAAHLLNAVLERFQRRSTAAQGMLIGISVLALVALVGAGVVTTQRRFASWAGKEDLPMLQLIRAMKAPQHTYLVPTDWRNFRLFTGAPTFVEYWFIPYNDAAVMEWLKRLRLAEAFYSASGARRCSMFGELAAGYGITHIVLKSSDSGVCGGWKLLFRHRDYGLYGAEGRQ